MENVPGAHRQPDEMDPVELVVRGHRFVVHGVQIYAYSHQVMLTDCALDVALYQGPTVVIVVAGTSAEMIKRVLLEEAQRRAPAGS